MKETLCCITYSQNTTFVQFDILRNGLIPVRLSSLPLQIITLQSARPTSNNMYNKTGNVRKIVTSKRVRVTIVSVEKY